MIQGVVGGGALTLAYTHVHAFVAYRKLGQRGECARSDQRETIQTKADIIQLTADAHIRYYHRTHQSDTRSETNIARSPAIGNKNPHSVKPTRNIRI